MFTGIIQTMGALVAQQDFGSDRRMQFSVPALRADIQLGDSIAINGVCLTAIALDDQGFSADVSAETLACTSLQQWLPGQPCNAELAVTPQTHLGGHVVAGHVDGLAEVICIANAGRSVVMGFRVPNELQMFIASKGSVCIDGVSLTVNQQHGAEFEVNLVPHTLSMTIMHTYQVGTQVNLEVDLLARYCQRLLAYQQAT